MKIIVVNKNSNPKTEWYKGIAEAAIESVVKITSFKSGIEIPENGLITFTYDEYLTPEFEFQNVDPSFQKTLHHVLEVYRSL